MLALTPEELAPTDTTDPAIEAIGSSPVHEIVIVGRRGPAQASWTTQELKEDGRARTAPTSASIPRNLESVDADDTQTQRNLEVPARLCGARAERPAPDDSLPLLPFAVAINGDSKVESIELVRNRLEDHDGRLVAVATDEGETLECGLVFRSVGYRGVGLPDVPFDEARGTIRNQGGRVTDAERTYCAGWIKRGPTGIIGTNKKDATDTVARLLEDVEAGRIAHNPDVTPDAVEAFLAARGVGAVIYSGWMSIDELEKAAGEKLGRPRVKLRTWDELLEAAERVAETA
jgi:ferredoxin--NADP+ reductase